MILLLTLLSTLVVAIVSYYRWHLGYWKRRGIPGPPGTIFIGNMHSLTDRMRPLGLVLRDWTKEYGKVYGIQEGLRNTLVISDVNMIRELFMQKFEYFYGRKNSALVGDVENDPRVSIFEAQGARWKRLRAISSTAFSAASLKKVRPTVEDSVLNLIKLLDEHAEQEAFDIHQFYKEFTIDVIYRIALGQQGSQMFKDDKMARVDAIFQRSGRQPVFYLASIWPSIGPILRKIYSASAKLRQSPIPLLFAPIYKAVNERIQLRESQSDTSESKEITDYIDLFLDARAEQNFDNRSDFSKNLHVEKQLTREEIVAQCFTFLVAGFDTTANSLAYATYLLSKHPEAQKHLQEEIDQYCNDTISYESLAAMKYLDCVMKEGLRMYPLANFANSRCCMKSTTLGDVKIEKGTYVIADTFTLHYDPEIWGDDANEFRPERWMDSNRPVAAWISFGLGPRQCIGMRLAYMEEKLVLAHLLKRYDILPAEDKLTLMGSVTISPKSVKVYLKRREQNS
ncbi:unnamed protein product [Cylicocyclus nassatus]|uniref:Uncharacterized protein n=1 Tax=Cylicocyclus nassatus TaxID=53992 RepID=A0AA36GX07_CYLNA|nr:unnamed protein product [Cylicocyclus nassatus]